MGALDLFFRCPGLFKGNLGSQEGVGVESRSEFLAAVEICLRQLDGREFFRFDAFREFAYREIENLFARHSGAPQEFFGVVTGIGFASFGEGFLSRSIKGLRYSPGPSPLSVANARSRSSGGCASVARRPISAL